MCEWRGRGGRKTPAASDVSDMSPELATGLSCARKILWVSKGLPLRFAQLTMLRARQIFRTNAHLFLHIPDCLHGGFASLRAGVMRHYGRRGGNDGNGG